MQISNTLYRLPRPLAPCHINGMWRPLIYALALSACTSFPDLDNTAQQDLENSEFPDLLPIGDLDPATGLGPTARADIISTTSARVANLRARAARLRGPVIDRRAKRRMQKGVALP